MADPLDRTPDPSLALTQAGRARSFRGELSGQLLLTPDSGERPVALRVPLFAAPRPASELTATAIGAPGAPLTRLAVTGVPARTSAGTASLISAFELGGEGERWPDCPPDQDGHGADAQHTDTQHAGAPCAARPPDRAGDLRAVGAASDAPTTGAADATLYLAATSWAPQASPAGAAAVRAVLDTDGDGVPDALVLADRLPGSDVLVARLLDARTGRQLDVQPLNARFGETDTDLLDSDTVVLPIRLSALPGFPAAGGRIRYAIWTGQAGAAPDPAHALSSIGLAAGRPTLETDPLHPVLDIRIGPVGPSAIVQPESPGTLLDVHRAAPGPARLLLVHHLNPDGQRAQLLTLPAG